MEFFKISWFGYSFNLCAGYNKERKINLERLKIFQKIENQESSQELEEEEKKQNKQSINLTCCLENFGVAAKFIFVNVKWIYYDDQLTNFTESSRLIECIRRKYEFSKKKFTW